MDDEILDNEYELQQYEEEQAELYAEWTEQAIWEDL